MKPIMQKVVEFKHWQIFAIILLPILNPDTNSVFDGLLFLFSFLFFIFWILSIGIILNDLLPVTKKANSHYFLFSAGFIIFYFVFILFFGGAYIINNYNSEEFGFWPWLIIPLHLYAMWSMFYMFYYSAKTISRLNITVNKKKDSTTAAYFFGFWFYFIGIWIIQPKVQELLDRRIDGL